MSGEESAGPGEKKEEEDLDDSTCVVVSEEARATKVLDLHVHL